VPERRHRRGLLDTSVVVALPGVPHSQLPEEAGVSAITFAELAAGPHATDDRDERARRQDRLQRLETTFDPIPFDALAARAYGRVYAAVAAAGRKARGRRALDLLIASTALAHGLPLYTFNPTDFDHLGDLIEVVALTAV
jgi:predicted nucleic acid-binding protein